jgi:hypothetical protein
MLIYSIPDNVNQTRIVNFVEGLAIPEDVPVIMLPARATDVERAPDLIAGSRPRSKTDLSSV